MFREIPAASLMNECKHYGTIAKANAKLVLSGSLEDLATPG